MGDIAAIVDRRIPCGLDFGRNDLGLHLGLQSPPGVVRGGGHEHLAAEPLVTAVYLSAMADTGFKASTINRRCQAIAFWH
jgi:hypothetical protein